MNNRVKMVLGGICNLIVLVTFALILVVLSENRVVHRVLAQTTAELNSNQVKLDTQDAGTYVGRKEPVPPDDPNEVPRTVFAFRGIPYAAPPIGELRWAPPQQVELKSTPHQAGDFKPPCSQWSAKKKKVIGAPDCLYLNVFSSLIPSTSKRRISGNVTSWTVENSNLLPVLVYVHGGEFLAGSASKYSPDALLKRERVVVVTFNFRLGALGWLSTGDPNSALSGNYGLQDQIAALKWVQKYIHRFGGNPLRVTIFGSVEYLLLANLQEEPHQPPLFHAAILKPQSTSVLSPFANFDSRESARLFMKQLADNVGCPKDATTDDYLIDCLRKADTDSLIRSQTKLLTFHNFPFMQYRASPLGPVVDGHLLEDEPEVLFSKGKFRDVPIMVGLSATEGYNPFLEFYLKLATKKGRKGQNKDAVLDNNNSNSGETAGMDSSNGRRTSNMTGVLAEGEVKEMLKNIMETVMAGIPDLEQDGAFDRVYESIWKYYFGGISAKTWSRDVDVVAQKLLKLFGDMLVNTGHCKLLQTLSQQAKAPVYSYVFMYGSGYFSQFFQETRETFENSEGMSGPKRPKRSLHMTLDTPWSEQYYLFHPIRDLDQISSGLPTTFSGSGGGGGTAANSESDLSEEDKKIMDALAKIWVSFAKYAQPKQAIMELPGYGRWVRMEPGHRSLNYYLISNTTEQRGMRSDFKKPECQFWMGTVPQVRKLSRVIQDLEPFPLLFWSSIAVVVLFALIIITLIVLIICAKRKTGSYGGANGIYLQSTRDL